MTYFDHVRCSACKAMIDPEAIASKPGQGLSCPRCGAPLSMGDLFGLKDAFAEEDQEELSLDDALSKMKAPTASVAPPEAAPKSRPAAARPAPTPAKPAPARSGAAAPPPSAPRQLPGPTAGSAAKGPRVPSRPLPAPPGAAPKPVPGTAAPAPAKAPEPGSALDAMMALRKKK